MDKTKLFKLAHLLLKFAEVPTDKGVLVSDGDLEVGVEVQLINADGEVVAAEDGEYKTEADVIKIEGGKVAEIAPIELPAEEEEEPAEELEEEAHAEEVPAVDEEKEQLKARVAELEATVAEKDAKIEELTAEIEQLKNKPVDEPIEEQLSTQSIKAEKKGAKKYFE